MSPIILTGTASPNIAAGIAIRHQFPLFFNRVVHFANSEMKITLADGISEKSSVVIVQSTCNPANDNFIELCLISDTLRREGVVNISAVIPYFGYSRQDKQHLPKECISVQTMAFLLKSIGVSKVYTLDIHNEKALEDCILDIHNISCLPILAKKMYTDLGLTVETEANFTIASPDEGGIQRAELFAKYFYQNTDNAEVISMKKERELDKIHISKTVELYGDIQDKNVILVDDVSTTGGTVLNAAELCKANGVKNVYAVIVHADFATGTAAKIQYSNITALYISNSIERTVENLDLYNKIQIVDVSSSFVL